MRSDSQTAAMDRNMKQLSKENFLMEKEYQENDQKGSEKEHRNYEVSERKKKNKLKFKQEPKREKVILNCYNFIY